MTDTHSPKRFASVFSTGQEGLFVVELREATQDSLRTVAEIKTTWEAAAPIIKRFMDSGDFSLN